MKRTLIKPLHQFILLGVLTMGFLACAPKQAYVVTSTNSNQNISEEIGAVDADVLKIIDPYKSKLDAQMDEKIGEFTATMDKEKPTSALTNFMADAMLDPARKMYPALGIDAAMMNYGGVRLNSVPKGVVTVRMMYELMPFDNTLVIMTLDSIKMMRLLDRIADSKGWPISKGIYFEIVDGRAVNATINGEAIKSKNSWVIALPNYVAEGGDNCDFLVDAPQEQTAVFIRDLLIDYVRDNKIINPALDKRIIVADEDK